MKAPQVRERGILFSGPMVRAILAGRKTQTRRAMRTSHVGYHSFARWDGEPFRRAMMRCLNDPGIATGNPSLRSVFCENNRYGVPGDRLWVRETHVPRYFDDGRPGYRADWTAPDGVPEPKWTTSLLMRRTDSRLTLEITNVRVERAHGISDADIAAEGVDAEAVEALWRGATKKRQAETKSACWGGAVPHSFGLLSPMQRWAAAWTLINGRASWDANPWLWCIDFRRLP